MKYAILTACLAAGLHSPVTAGEFSAAPVRIFMAAAERAAAVTVTNEGDDDLLMQAEVFRWAQKPDGEDELVATDDLMLSPPVMKLGPRSVQVVRLIRLGPPPVGEEVTYRVFLREVPVARPAGTPQVQFALAFSLPIFITPTGAKRRVECVLVRPAADKLQAVCGNDGSAYAQVRQLSLQGTSQPLAQSERAGYVLPGAKRTFELRSTAPVPAGRHRLLAAFDDGAQQVFDAFLAD